MSEKLATSPKRPERKRTRNVIKRLAVGAAALAIAAGVVEVSSSDSDDVRPERTKVVQVDNKESLAKKFDTQLANEGYAASVEQPSPAQLQKFQAKYRDHHGKVFAKAPELQEVVKVADQKSEFTIYNATRQPVDVPFIRYTADALRAWSDAHHANGVNIMGNVRTKLRSDKVPHDIVFTDSIPQFIVDPSGHVKAGEVPSVTVQSTDPIAHGRSTAWVMPYRSMPHEDNATRKALGSRTQADDYNARKFLAVEICHSMYAAHESRVLPGRERALQPSFKIIEGANPAAKALDMYAQEEVCNSVSRLSTALYVSDIPGAQSIGSSLTNLEGIKVFDGNIADGELVDFSRIKQTIMSEPTRVLSVSGQVSPTLHGLRQPT